MTQAVVTDNWFNLSSEDMDTATRVYRESVVIDTLTYMGTGLSDPSYLYEMRDAGVTCCNITLTDQTTGFRDACIKISAWVKEIDEHSDVAMLALSADDIERAKRENKVAILAGMQNGKPIEDSLELVRVFHRLGIRAIIPSYHYQNYLSSGGGERGNYGLSRFGRNVIREMNRLGIAVDLSHCNEATARDAIECSVKPVCFTHANPTHFQEHHRNKSDDLLRAMAEQGGVIGLTAWSEHLEVALDRRPTVVDMVDMIEYVIDLVGDDHVGFGLDLTPQWVREGPAGYDAFGQIYPEMFNSVYEDRNFAGLERPGGIIDITRGLLARGHSEETIKKVNGGNWLRFFRDVWDNPARDAEYPEAVHILGGS
jgi:membrane dipeptidase